MEEVIIARLLSDTGVTEIAGENVTPGRREQGQRGGAVTVKRISGGEEESDDGADDLNDARFQVDCSAETYTEAKQLAAAVKASLRNYKTTDLGAGTHGVFLEDERDFNEGGGNQAEYLYRTSLDYQVWHSEGD